MTAVVLETSNQLDSKEKEAVRYVHHTIQKYKGYYPYVSFSGGKDSLVTAHVVRQVIPGVKLIYTNTTLELPGVVKYVENLRLSKWNIDIAKPTVTFTELVTRLGPPSNKKKWCCDTLKKPPIWGHLRELSGNRKWLGFLGLRAAESVKRSHYQREHKDFAIPTHVLASPIVSFSEDDVWDYIRKYDLPYCRLYDRPDIKRLGCISCPMAGEKYDNTIEKIYPEEATYWKDLLKDYARQRGFSDYWYKNAWRASYPESLTLDIVGTKEDLGHKTFRYRFDKSVHLREMFFIPFKNHPEVKIKILPGNRSLLVQQQRWLPFKILLRVEVQILKNINCVNCGWCVSQCEHIRMKDGGVFIDDGCNGCLDCTWKQKCILLVYGGRRRVFKEEK